MAVCFGYVSVLKYTRLGWGDREVAELSTTLREVGAAKLRLVDLSENPAITAATIEPLNSVLDELNHLTHTVLPDGRQLQDEKCLQEKEHTITAEGNKQYKIGGTHFETTPDYAVREAVRRDAYGIVCSGRNALQQAWN